MATYKNKATFLFVLICSSTVKAIQKWESAALHFRKIVHFNAKNVMLTTLKFIVMHASE